MNESPNSHYVTGIETMNARADELIQTNLLEADRMHQIELKKMSADVQVLNSQADVELNGYTSVKTLADGSTVTTTMPNMFERRYKLRSDGKNPQERQRVRDEVDAYESEYRSGIAKLMQDDGLELCQAKMVMDFVIPRYDQAHEEIERRIQHQEKLLIKGGMNKSEATQVARKMYRRMDDKVELNTRKTLGLISGTGEYGRRLGLYSIDELNQLSSVTKPDNSKEEGDHEDHQNEVMHDHTENDPKSIETKERTRRRSIISRGLGTLAVVVASKIEKRRDIAKANKDYSDFKYGGGKVKLHRPSDMTKDEYLAKRDGLRDAFLDDYISAREMNAYNASMLDRTTKKYEIQKRDKRKLQRRDDLTKLAKGVVRKLS